jgi:DNA-binding XRE family transcriptional regulator
MADELLLESQLHLIREELEISQKELAATLGIKQPSLSAIGKIVVMILKFQR